jgi:hypothetical protein
MMELSDKMRPYFDEVIMKYERGNLVDDETLISICESYIDWYKVHEDVLLRNILEVYRTTNYEKGYSVLTHDWLRVREYCKDREKVDAIEGIRLNVFDKMRAVMSHLYQAMEYKKFDYRFSFIGLLVVAFINVRIEKSEKRGKCAVHVDYGIELVLGDHEAKSFEMDG